MRKIREVLRLTLDAGLSPRQVSASLSVPRVTVRRYLDRAAAAGLSWPLPEGMDDAELEALLFPPCPPSRAPRPAPDFAQVHREMRRKGVTLQLLWLEYRERYPDGYAYSQFCLHYASWREHVDLPMRQRHRAGEKCFIDYSGQTLPILDLDTGRVWQAEVFIAVLGASNYTYAEACRSQQLADWLAAHVAAFEFFTAVPTILVPDNLRSGVSVADRYEPEINRSYAELAAHYGTVVIPARSRKPRDKAKVEVGVQIAEREILARLRNLSLTSLGEANAAIRVELNRLNARPFAKLDGSRQQLFEALDRPAMRPLPAQRYEFATFEAHKVNIDYHIEVDHHYYSVPHQLVGARLDIRLAAHTVEAFFKARRVASHRRSFVRGGFTTLTEHMPAAHREHLSWSPSRLIDWAERTGPSTAALVHAILTSRPHPEQGYRSCLGILRLSRRYEPARLEAACARALAIGARSYRSVDSILAAGLDRTPLPAQPAPASSTPPRDHEHLRGPDYYQ